MESKKDIRRCVLEERNSIEKEEWLEKSQRIYEKVIEHPLFLNSEEIYCYIDFKNEVGTRKIIAAAWKLGKKVAVPKIMGNHMEFFYIQNFDELFPGTWKILEPNAEDLACGFAPLVIMPGAVFDKARHRIGYGKGYYDRYLAKHTNCQTMALAFELQILENIPADAYDICPQIIVTEEHIYD
jgi:5-formyltetrahydrofolate cyclo-ligase